MIVAADQALNIRALKDVPAKTVTARGEAADGGGSNDYPLPVAASRLSADQDGVARVRRAPRKIAIAFYAACRW